MTVPGSRSTTDALDGSIDVRLQRLTWAGDDVRIFELRTLDGAALPSWEAGAHVDVALPNGLVRPYSLLPGAPGEPARPDTYRIAVKRAEDSTGATRWLFSRGQVGAELAVSAPRNTFPLGAGPAVLIGGGIGITPFVAMAAALARRGEPSWALHYAVGRRQQAALYDELAPYGERLRLHVDAEAGNLLDVEAIVAGSGPDEQLYCCGPNAMLAAFEAAVSACGAADRAHVEYFSPAHEPALGGGYTIVMARSGTRLDIAPGASILGTLRKAGLSAISSCERGTCGSCEVAVLGGTPDHRDSVLSPEEKEDGTAMMICCSGSLSPELILDL